MKTMIKSWRALWGYEFPFYQVELAPFKGVGPTAAKKYPLIRHKQAKAVAETEDAYDICILDAGEELNIHPRHKKIVGERLGRVVMKHTYGDNSLVADCPRVIGISKEPEAIVISFANAAGGIEVREGLGEVLKINQGGLAKSYIAETDGDKLVLLLRYEAHKPVEIKYCEENFCNAALFNSEGNPVYGFEFEA